MKAIDLLVDRLSGAMTRLQEKRDEIRKLEYVFARPGGISDRFLLDRYSDSVRDVEHIDRRVELLSKSLRGRI